VGNLEDITIRALNVLGRVDIIAAEDTREARRLLSYHKIEAGGRLVSCHEHNEQGRLAELISRLLQGESMALITDAGTPTVSDPGFPLVRKAIEEGISVIPVPGPSAVTAALAVSGLPTDAFFFEGFLPKKPGKRGKRLGVLADIPATLVFFESPRRITETLREMVDCLGDRSGVVCRAMTKPFEEFVRGRLTEILQVLEQRPAVKGEITLVVAGNTEKTPGFDREAIRREVETADCGASELASKLSARYGVAKKKVYKEILQIKKEMEDT
jgi:16S rRNA (cytidine1402-2'-O)-methyltransferase